MIDTLLTQQRPPQQPYTLEPTEAVAGEFVDAEIGVEKIDFMSKLFTPEDLGMMLRLRMAFNPDGRCSPRKMLPTAGACIEPSKAGRRAAL